MKAKLSLVALALASALPLAALADSKHGASSDYGTPAAPATSVTPAMPSGNPAAAAKPAEPPAKPGMAGFKDFDKNKDGKLSQDELSGSADLQSRFTSLDSNHDGAISAREYELGTRAPQQNN